ncbi:MAG: hypothetical protein CW341_07665 [Bacteroidetes bacterium]|nr:hypothetical protein [Bacteroidota bacterium]
MAQKKSRTGIWIILVAAMMIAIIFCIQYFYGRASLRKEAEQRAQSELRRAELEINVVAVETETMAKMLTTLAERDVDNKDSIVNATRTLLHSLKNVNCACIACTEYLFPEEGRWFEIYSSRQPDGNIQTLQIGGADHDYFQTEWYRNGVTIDSCYWSEPYMDYYGAHTMVVTCTHPIRNKQGDVVAVAGMDVSLNYLQLMSEYLQIYKDSYYTIRSREGLEIVAGIDTVPGRKYYVYDEYIEKTGWKISIIIPEDVIFEGLNKVRYIVEVLMFIGLALLIFIVWHASRDNKRLMVTTAKNQRMENELHIARTIQMAMLPRVFPPFKDRPDLNLYGMVDPAKEVGGDLYDFYVRQNKLLFCVGDVSGKGVPAALVMAMTRTLFRNASANEEDTAAIVSGMNKALAEQNSQNMFLTFFLGILDCETGKLSYCNAGHNAPVLLRHQKKEAEKLHVVANLPLGIMDDFIFQAQEVQMNCDDVIFLYTDGLTEAEDKNLKQYGDERMLQHLALISDSRPRTIIENMRTKVNAFVDGAQQNDDLTMLAIRYQTPAVIMSNDIQQIPLLAQWVNSLDIPEKQNMAVNLALEEIVSNIIFYAYPDKKGQIYVEFAKKTENEIVKTEKDTEDKERLSAVNGQLSTRLMFTITDSGIPFDPTKHEEVDISLSAEERQIGGLGIHLVRQLMDEIHYRREEDKNVLTLIKKI